MKAAILLLLAIPVFGQAKPEAKQLSYEDKYNARTIQMRWLVAQKQMSEAQQEMQQAQQSLKELSDKACGVGFHLDLGKTANDPMTCVKDADGPK